MYYWLYLISLASLSQASVIIRWSQTDPLLLGIWRLFFAAIILRSWVSLQKADAFKIKMTRSERFSILMIGFLVFVHLYSYATAAHSTTIAHLMLIYSVNPIFTTIGNLLLFKEKITKKVIVAFLFSFSGIYYLVRQDLTLANSSIKGDALAIVAALTFSLYILLSKKARKTIPNSILTSSFYGVASFFFLITSLALDVNPIPQQSHSWMAIVLLAIFPTLLGHGLFTYCVKYLDIQILSLGKLIEPIMSATSAWFIFGEPITLNHIVAFVLIATGISIVVISPKPSPT